MPLFLAVFLFFSSALHSYETILGICAIFRDEARFLKEWIDYHRIVGVEEFWLYNNKSDDDYLTVLQPYIEEGIVHLTQWPSEEPNENIHDHWTNEVQPVAYNDCFYRCRGHVKWMAFIDIDEFIVPIMGDSIPSILESNFAKKSGVVVNWVHFGTSFVEEIKPDELLIEKLTRRASMSYDRNRLYKSIVQLSEARKCTNPHFFRYYRGWHVDTNWKRVVDDTYSGPFFDKLRINHYWTKDEKYLREVKAVNYTKWNNRPYQETLLALQDVNETLNQEEDREILRFVDRLKKESR